MSKKTIYLLSILVFTQFFLSNKVKADDLVLSGSINGYYYSNDDIYTQNTCVVEEGNTAVLVTLNTIALNPGFSVELGSTLIAKIDDSDSDDDGLPDEWEWEHFGSFYQGADDDISDMDGLTNIEEYQNQTDPKDSDTDSDEMPDGWEVEFGLDPIEDDADGDLDEDLYSNYVEYIAETDPDDVYSTPDPGYYHKYDPLGRLEKIVYLDDYEIEYEIVYDYDSVGNRTSREVR